MALVIFFNIVQSGYIKTVTIIVFSDVLFCYNAMISLQTFHVNFPAQEKTFQNNSRSELAIAKYVFVAVIPLR